MLREGHSADAMRAEPEHLRLGLFAVALSLILTLLMLILRVGLPTPPMALLVGPAILSVAVLPPLLLARALWVGPLAALGLLIGCALAAIGIVGTAILWIAALGSIGVAVMRTRRDGPGRLWLWTLLLIVTGLLSAQLINGSKYLSFVADQLLLYGRTDGDMMFHGAITNAYRYFHFPSTGIDGLKLLRYHTGIDALAAMIAAGSRIDAVLALIVVRAQILFPLTVFAAAWAGSVLGRALLPTYAFRPLGLTVAALLLVVLQQCGSFPELGADNDPLLLSGNLLLLIMPTVTVDLLSRRSEAWASLVLAVIAVAFLCLAKVSTGTMWCAFAGYLVLRSIGPKRAAFWITGVAMLLVFLLSTLLTTEPGQSGAVWFGTPFFVEYGFRKGNYDLPLQLHAYLLVALLAMLGFRKTSAAPQTRYLFEALLVTAALANLVGLVLQIPGADAVFFFSAVSWLVLPLLVMLAAAVPQIVRRFAPRGRRLAWGAVAVVLVAATVDGGVRTVNRFYLAVSAAALLHTGDLTYYASDRRRVWRADARRALAEHGLLGLYRLPPPTPLALGLQDALAAAKRADPATAAYIPPQSDYWNQVRDCDGRSLWPMAAAGVPLIDGYVPVQDECPQEFALTGYGTPPPVRVPLSDSELSRRAAAAGFPVVLEIESLKDRTKDRLAAPWQP
ncbi:hypothetical protein [Dongia sedimenti]|uniref:4-amino-4-deoxy-L-arabinose transferase-like glycosyltransferase n=1 Tax=Dongia sedimenti TaxID=3064282 RepID=A0ABU0YH29_9PROT|nr:hypothetical protein [Rhodospirillaceae bacterium R-7]